MKSLLTFLAFNIVLLICCYEKKCAGSLQESARHEPADFGDTFIAKFSNDKSDRQQWDSRMHMVITNGFVNGYYCEEDLCRHINVVGAVKDGNEIILIESENGQITRTFQGVYQRKGKGALLVFGIWKDTNLKMLDKSGNGILPHSDPNQTIFLTSKRQ